jgi:hypothetical protein
VTFAVIWSVCLDLKERAEEKNTVWTEVRVFERYIFLLKLVFQGKLITGCL